MRLAEDTTLVSLYSLSSVLSLLECIGGATRAARCETNRTRSVDTVNRR